MASQLLLGAESVVPKSKSLATNTFAEAYLMNVATRGADLAEKAGSFEWKPTSGFRRAVREANEE
jgi:hypothetical protein